MKCSNCNANLSCGCQRRTASDRTRCCSGCITVYEKKLIGGNVRVTPSEPVVQTNIWGANKYVNIKK